MQTAGALVGGVRYGVDARRRRVLLWQALPRGVRSEGALRPLRQRVDSPVEPRPRVALEAECRQERTSSRFSVYVALLRTFPEEDC